MRFRHLFFLPAIVLFFFSCGSSKHGVSKSDSRKADNLIHYAGKFTGVPYKSGGATPKGFDCSGFTQFVFKEFGYDLPRTTGEQNRVGVEVKKDDIKPGDLVFFTGSNKKSKKPGHVGIVVNSTGKGRFLFIHASGSRGVTVTGNLETYYKPRYLSARRII